jgi:hypothetical protein
LIFYLELKKITEMSVLRVDALDTSVVYSAKCTIDTSKRFNCKGGYTVGLKLHVSTSDGRTTPVNSFMITNCSGFHTFSDKTKNDGGKAKIGFSKEKNPALIQCFIAIEEAIAEACDNAGIFKPKPYIARASTVVVDGVTKEYDDTLFIALKLTPGDKGCATIMLQDTNGVPIALTGNDEIEAGEEISTIKSYVKSSGHNKSFCDYLSDLYGCEINIVSNKNSPDKIVKVTCPRFKTRKSLINPGEFNSIMGPRACNLIAFQIKSCYLRTTDSTTYCTLVANRSKSALRPDSNKEEDDLWMMETRSRNTPSVVEVQPDDLDDLA